MHDWLVLYIQTNFDDLMKLDLHWAQVLGAPKGYTLSGYSYELEQKGRTWGAFWRPVIDHTFKWLWNQDEHCKKAHAEDLERVNA